MEFYKWVLLKESVLPAILEVYHCGAVFDEFSINFVGRGEGLAALGPGIYFSDCPGISRLYCKYANRSQLYQAELNTTGIYNNRTGQPERLTQELSKIITELGYDINKFFDMPMGDLKTGMGTIGTVFKILGKDKGWQKLISHGITGASEKLPSGCWEIVCWDMRAIKSIKKTRTNKEGKDMTPEELETERQADQKWRDNQFKPENWPQDKNIKTTGKYLNDIDYQLIDRLVERFPKLRSSLIDLEDDGTVWAAFDKMIKDVWYNQTPNIDDFIDLLQKNDIIKSAYRLPIRIEIKKILRHVYDKSLEYV